MAIRLQDKINKVSKKRRQKIDSRAEELTLQELRNAMEQTQVELAQTLQMNQEGISRLERRSDMLLSTLKKYVRAMGGELHIIAQFPDKAPVAIRGFSDAGNTCPK